MPSEMSGIATIADLYRSKERAELVAGRIVVLGASGYLPSCLAMNIMCSLHEHAEKFGIGEVFGSKLAYEIDPPLPNGRESFSPSTSYFVGPHPENRMHFIKGAPTFAVEVRDEDDYSPDALTQHAAKRADYFLAGTKAVWDVDPLGESVTLYLPTDPTVGVVFRHGDLAHAEPAVPAWRVTIDELFQ